MKNLPINGTRPGFTIAEMAFALGIGLFIIQVAYSSLSFSQKFIAKTRLINEKNSLTKAAILSSASGAYLSDYYRESSMGLAISGQKLAPSASATSGAELQELFICEQVRVRTEYSGPQVPVANPNPSAGLGVVTTAAPHGLQIGHCFEFQGMTDSSLNNCWSVVEIVSPRRFIFGFIGSPIVNKDETFEYGAVIRKGHGRVLQYSRSSGVATIVSGTGAAGPSLIAANHGLRVGQSVLIHSCPTASFNGRYSVKSITNATTFKFDCPGVDETHTETYPGATRFQGYLSNLVLPMMGN
ncbi:MAG: hypothetical protein L6R48_08790 [Planctomycetes bacterium]|nr:hypothetical protein [Planctomycetota bacterium]